MAQEKNIHLVMDRFDDVFASVARQKNALAARQSDG